MLSFSAPPCCASCKAALSEAVLSEALLPLEQFHQALRTHTLGSATLFYPLRSFSCLYEYADRCIVLATQPPLYLRCEILLI